MGGQIDRQIDRQTSYEVFYRVGGGGVRSGLLGAPILLCHMNSFN